MSDDDIKKVASMKIPVIKEIAVKPSKLYITFRNRSINSERKREAQQTLTGIKILRFNRSLDTKFSLLEVVLL
jgi:hypothetical protein